MEYNQRYFCRFSRRWYISPSFPLVQWFKQNLAEVFENSSPSWKLYLWNIFSVKKNSQIIYLKLDKFLDKIMNFSFWIVVITEKYLNDCLDRELTNFRIRSMQMSISMILNDYRIHYPFELKRLHIFDIFDTKIFELNEKRIVLYIFIIYNYSNKSIYSEI